MTNPSTGASRLSILAAFAAVAGIVGAVASVVVMLLGDGLLDRISTVEAPPTVNPVPTDSPNTGEPTSGPTASEPTASEPTTSTPPPTVDAPVSDDEDCYATARRGSLELPAGGSNAGGPNYTSAACRDLHITLTSVSHRTYAQACFESPNGDVTHCGREILLSYPDTWDTLATNVPAHSRWQLRMRSDGEDEPEFYYTQ